MGAAARQECPEGQGRALDEEERCELLRLQEPPRRGQSAQADPQMGCDGRGRARQSEAGRCARSLQYRQGGLGAGKTPEGWEQQPAKNAQKDKDARWTKKNDASFFGYKNHLGVDKAHKLIRKWDATDAAVHDSQKLDDVLDFSNTGNGVWADSAYRSVQIEAGLTAKGLQSHIHRRAARNRPLSERQKSANTTRSRVRARVEHVFGHQQNSMGGKIVRTIGIARARFKIGMMNLGYNIRRLVQLERLAAVPA